MGERTTPKPRKSFSKLPHILDLPNLIAVQTESFEWFKDQGLKETIDDINPIEDYTGNYAVEFGEYQFNEPPLSLKECRDKDQTYAAPLFITVRFVNRESGEIREQNVFMGDFPMMTEQGTFIINGTERVIVTQLVRSPGAYVMAAKDPTKQVLIANLMPARGSWLEFEIDKRGAVSVRIDRKRKLPATVFLRALAGIDSQADRRRARLPLQGHRRGDPRSLRRQPVHQGHPREGLRPLGRRGPGRAVQEAAPGRTAHARGQPQPAVEHLLRPQALRPHPGRPAQAQRPPEPRHRPRRPHPHQGRHRRPGEGTRGGPAGHRPRALARGRPRPGRSGPEPALGRGGQPAGRIRALRQPPPAHGGRVGAGSVPRRPLPHGAGRPRADDHRGRRHHHAAVHHQHPPGGGGSQGVLRQLPALAVHGPDQLAGGPHPPAAALGPGRRRPHPGARAHRGARRAPDALRAHVPHRDAGRSQHRPDRLAVELRHGQRVRLHPDAVPQGGRRQGHRRHRVADGLSGREAHHRPGQRPGRSEDRQVRRRHRPRPGAGRRIRERPPGRRRLSWTSPRVQIVSVATALIPFLEHNDANRALMGSNMQRQAVPLLGGRSAADRHGHGVPLGGRHRRRAPGQAARQGAGRVGRPASCSRPTTATSTPTTCSSSSGPTRAPSSTRSRWSTWATRSRPGRVLADGASTKRRRAGAWAATCSWPS